MINNKIILKIKIGNKCKLQKNGTPRINPIKSGGSPIGVRHPPILEIMKIKNIMICALFFLHEFILIIGRTSSILAPVVPIQLDNKVPNAKNKAFTAGEPARLPSSVIFPDTQNRPNNKTIKVR